MTYEDWLVEEVIPTWLRDTWGERWFRALGRMADLVVDGAKQAVKARFVRLAPTDALDALGWERLIERGPNESHERYRERVSKPWDVWPQAGTAGGIQAALQGYGLGSARVYNHRTVTTPAKSYNWRFDDNDTNWSRLWVVLDPEAHPWTPLVAADTLLASDELLAGITMTASEFRTLRRLVHRWRPAHGLAADLLVVFEAPMAADDLIAEDGLLAGGDVCSLPLGQFAGYGFAQFAHDSLLAGYYQPEV